MSVAFAILSLLPIVSFASENNKYTIIHADGRTFLLDMVEGNCYRYYFNNVNEQGWQRTTINLGISDGKQYYQFIPGGQLLDHPINN